MFAFATYVLLRPRFRSQSILLYLFLLPLVDCSIDAPAPNDAERSNLSNGNRAGVPVSSRASCGRTNCSEGGDSLRLMQMELYKLNLLHALQLRNVPALKPTESQKDLAKRLFEKDEGQRIKRSMRSLAASEQCRKKLFLGKIRTDHSNQDENGSRSERVLFQVEENVDYELEGAYLYLPVKRGAVLGHAGSRGRVDMAFKLTEYKENKIDLADPHMVETIVVEGGRLNRTSHNVTVTDLVRKWMERPSVNHGFAVECTVNGVDILPNSFDDMFLELIMNKRGPCQQEESAVCQADNPTSKNCCRYELEIDFESFGWDFILAPKRYQAYYCAGRCPLSEVPRNNYVRFIQQIDAMKQMEGSPKLGVCCAPDQMAPLKMMVLTDANQMALQEVPGMKVQSCVCS